MFFNTNRFVWDIKMTLAIFWHYEIFPLRIMTSTQVKKLIEETSDEVDKCFYWFLLS